MVSLWRFSLALCLMFTPCYSADFYVAQRGNNTNGDGTMVNPWQDIQFAIDTLKGSTSDTVVLHVAEGLYSEALHVEQATDFMGISVLGGYDADTIPWSRDIQCFQTTLDPGDEWPAIDFYAVQGETTIDGLYIATAAVHVTTGVVSRCTILSGGDITFPRIAEENTVFEGRIFAETCTHNLVIGGEIGACDAIENTIISASEVAVWMRGLARGNEIFSTNRYGIKTSGGPSTIIDNVIIGGQYGVYAEYFTGTIECNVVAMCDYGMSIDVGTTPPTIRNNTVLACGIGIRGSVPVSSCIIRDSGRKDLTSGSARYCCLTSDYPGEGNIVADPKLVGWGDFSLANPICVDGNYTGDIEDGTSVHPFKMIRRALEKYDFHLSSDSPCIGAGEGGIDIGAYPNAASYQPQGSAAVKITVAPGYYPEAPFPLGLGAQLVGAGAALTEIGTIHDVIYLGMVRMRSNSLIEGFTIRYGTQIWCNMAGENVIVRNNVFCDGAGVDCFWDGAPEIINNVIVRNSIGIATYGYGECNPRIIGNTISDNRLSGLSMRENWLGEIRNNVIERNGGEGIVAVGLTAPIVGNRIGYNAYGGIDYDGGIDEISGNFIYGNADNGILLNYADPLIANNTIYGNGIAGIARDRTEYLPSNPTVVNCILWENADDIEDFSVTYSCISDGAPGKGNISLNPRFVNPEAGDFHLLPDSPCINAGTTITAALYDFDGDPIPQGVGVDMGADEFRSSWVYTFDSGTEAWGFNTLPGVFSQPQGEWNTGELQLVVIYNTNCFGFWQSPLNAITLLPDSLYRTQWEVSTSYSSSYEAPAFRLRVNRENMQESTSLVVNSTQSQFGGLAVADSAEQYRLYIENTATTTGLATLSFDFLGFNSASDPEATIALEGVTIDRLDKTVLTTPTLIAQYDFLTSTQGWSFSGEVTPFTPPASGWDTAGSLRLTSVNNTDCFGFWQSEPILIQDSSTDMLLRATFKVSSDQANPALTPTLRLRTIRTDLHEAAVTTIESLPDGKAGTANGSSSPSTASRNYSQYYWLSPGETSASIRLALDLLNFSPADSPGASLFLEHVNLETFSLPSP